MEPTEAEPQPETSDEPLSPHLTRAVVNGDCVLFVGAGSSVDAGAPQAQALADELAAHFLGAQPSDYSLSEAAATVEAAVGRKELNEWIGGRLSRLEPTEVHRQLTRFPWRAIYTVNFDQLIEQAYENESDPARRLRTFYSNRDRLSGVRPGEIPLYKLHGCITRSNSDDGFLTLTAEDAVRSRQQRSRMYSRLVEDMSDTTIVFVGFSRRDPDFAEVVVRVEEAAGTLGLRRNYAVQPDFTEPEQQRWEQRRITLLRMTASRFLEVLAGGTKELQASETTEEGGDTRVDPLRQGHPNVAQVTAAEIERAFEVIDARVTTDLANIDLFFVGATPSWGAILERVDARRDITDDILSLVLEEPVLDRPHLQVVIIHAEGGAGKTTLLRRLGIDLAFDWQRLVLSLKPYGSLVFSDVERLINQSEERVYCLVDNAPRVAQELSSFLQSARRARVKLTVIATARTNEWRDVQDAFAFPAADEFELGPLSRAEIDGVITTLERNQALGLLEGASHEAKVEAFEQRAQKQLLVALREATEGLSFDEIIVDEYDKIPSPDGQRAYLLVAALHRFGILTRAALLHRSLNLSFDQMADRVFKPTEKVIVPAFIQDDVEALYSTRHSLIANIVFDRKLTNERRKADFYLDLISRLDIGYDSDADAYRQLAKTRNKQLLRGFADIGLRRQVMQALLTVDPLDAWAYQHAAMMEMDAGELEGAGRHLSTALELKPNDAALKDTQGRLLARLAARQGWNQAEANLEKAENLFRRNIQRSPEDPHAYLSLAETYEQWAHQAPDPEDAARYIGLSYQTLTQGIARAPNAEMLMSFRGQLEERAGDTPGARESYAAVLARNAAALGTRFLAARLETRDGDLSAALSILEAGLGPSGQDPELHFRIADLLARHDSSRREDIVAHFEAALLGPLAYYAPRIAYAAYLFGRGEYDRAMSHFAQLDDLVVVARERFQSRSYDYPGCRGAFDGVVRHVAGRGAWIEHDRGATQVHWRWREESDREPRVGGTVHYEVAFNLKGPLAVRVATR